MALPVWHPAISLPAEPTWNPAQSRYEFHTPDGTLCVDGDVYGEAEAQAKKDFFVEGDASTIRKFYKALDELNNWTTWDECQDGETVYYV